MNATNDDEDRPCEEFITGSKLSELFRLSRIPITFFDSNDPRDQNELRKIMLYKSILGIGDELHHLQRDGEAEERLTEASIKAVWTRFADKEFARLGFRNDLSRGQRAWLNELSFRSERPHSKILEIAKANLCAEYYGLRYRKGKSKAECERMRLIRKDLGLTDAQIFDKVQESFDRTGEIDRFSSNTVEAKQTA